MKKAGSHEKMREDGSAEVGDDAPGEPDFQNQAYFQKSFGTILATVGTTFGHILLDAEKNAVARVGGLEGHAQRLFFRLCLRREGWFRQAKLEYRDIGSIADATQILKKAELLEDDGSASLQDYLSVMLLDEMKHLARMLKIKKTSGKREELVSLLLSESRSKQARLTFGTSHQLGLCRPGRGEDLRLLMMARELCGSIIRIPGETRVLMQRLVGLFFLGKSSIGEAGSHYEVVGSLSAAILTDLNRRRYPSYKIIRSRPVFVDRASWLAYDEALHFEAELARACEAAAAPTPIIDFLHLTLETVLARWTVLLAEGMQESGDDRSTVYFLARFSAGWVYTRILGFLASALEKARDYERASMVLETLLGQEKYCLGSRGRWWERLILNLSTHLGRKEEAARLCQQALDDPHVRTGSRFSIARRQRKLLGQEFELETKPANVITFYADAIAPSAAGRKLAYRLSNGGEEAVGSVEEFALEQFRAQGWVGFHCESGVVRMLFTLIFWDILYQSDLADVYQTPYQNAPLDLGSDAFYGGARRDQLEGRLEEVGQGLAPLIVAKAYDANQGCMAIGCDWEAYPRAELLNVCHALGKRALAGILRYLCEDYRGAIPGIPDLLLYRPDCSDHLLVEVKSTNDRLSDAQRNWNLLFKQLSVNVALCQVLPTHLSPNRI